MNFKEDFLARRSQANVKPTVKRLPEGGNGKRSAGPTQNIRQILSGNIIGAAKMTRLEESWASMPWTADAYIYQHWQTLCARSRVGCEDYDHLRRFLALIKDNVPGPAGFRLTPCPLEANGKVDREAAKAIMRSFKQWSKPKNCDFGGRMSRAEIERLAVSTTAKDGEILAILHTGKSAGPWGFSVELMDPFLLDPRHYEKLSNGNVIRHGIEFPEDGGRPVAYHFREQDEQRQGYIITNRTRRVDASRVIHWFVTEIVSQKRGLPWTRTALWRMRMLSGFEDSALTNARVCASKVAFIKSTGEDDINEDELPMDMEPGTIENIGDRDIASWNPNYPDAQVDPFVRTMLRSVATGLLTSYHSISGDLTSVSFSSIRQGTLDDRQCYLAIQGSQEDGFCLPIYDAWLEYSLLAEKITLPNGKPLPWQKLEKYLDAAFTGRRWPWIDPASEANAAQIMIAQRIRSRSEIIRDIGDRDPEEVWDEIEAENAAMAERGIVPLIPAGSAPEGEDPAAPGKPGAPAQPAVEPKSGISLVSDFQESMKTRNCPQ